MSSEGNGWIEKYSKLITTLGIPTVLSGILLWFVLFRLIVILDAIVVDVKHQTHVLDRLNEAIEQRQRELEQERYRKR